MRILVVQTTRMGDVLQTSPLIHELREKHPEAHITVMVRGMGKVVAEHHPAVDEVIVYNEDELFQDLCARDSDRLLRAYENADARVRQLRDGQYDVVYNMTHSLASAMLLKLADVPEVVGAHLSDDWQFVLRGTWTTYFFMSVFSRDYNDLNLCDISRQFAVDAPPCRQLVFDVRDEDRQFVQKVMEKHGIENGDFVACFQLGASETNKRWSEKRFAELAQLMAEHLNAKVFLVGVKEESPLGENFAQHAPGAAIPLYGETSIPQLAALLERANVLVTNDTGTMHMAAAVNCPIALVSVGHVHYRETGPYGPGHCAIEWRRRTLGRSDYVPGGEEEQEQITPQQVYRAVQLVLNDDATKPVPQLEETPELKQVDLFMTRFAPDGCLQFYPVMRRAMTKRDFIRIAYRKMWLDHLQSGHANRTERESIQEVLRHFEGPALDTLESWRNEHVKVFGELAALYKRGMKATEALLDILRKKKSMEKAKQLVAELMALDEEARVFSEINPPCRPLILLARFERDNLEGADPLHLAKTTLRIYQSGFQRARLVAKKLERIVDVAKG